MDNFNSPKWWLLAAVGAAGAAAFYGHRSWSEFIGGYSFWWRDAVGAAGFAGGAIYSVCWLLIHYTSKKRSGTQRQPEREREDN